MTTAMVYNWPEDQWETFLPFAERWSNSYLQFCQGFPHKLYVCVCGTGSLPECLKRLNPRVIRYLGSGFDIGMSQHAAKHISEDLMITGTSRHYFYRANPIARMAEVFEKYPDSLLCTMTSYEACPIGPFSFPNAHIRTAYWGISPARFRRYPYDISNRERGFLFESGEWAVNRWFDACGLRTIQVTWDSAHDDKRAWARIPNRFRNGDQSSSLVYDKHSEAYSKMNPAQKREVEKRTWGLRIQIRPI